MIILGHEPMAHLMQLRGLVAPEKDLLPTRFDPEDLVIRSVSATEFKPDMISDPSVSIMQHEPVTIRQKSQGIRSIG